MPLSNGRIVRIAARKLSAETTARKNYFLLNILTDEFIAAGKSMLTSEEEAEEWLERFREAVLQEYSLKWVAEGLDLPIEPGPNARMFIGPLHPTYSGNITEKHYTYLRQILASDDRELGLLGCVALTALGATQVHFVDRAGDAGVDVLAAWLGGATHGGCVCLQAKAWAGGLTGTHIENAYDAYFTGLGKPVWRQYLQFIRADEMPGLGRAFLILSRDGYNDGALHAARSKGALCWGPYRLSHILASHVLPDRLQAALQEINSLARNREVNLAPPIRLAVLDR